MQSKNKVKRLFVISSLMLFGSIALAHNGNFPQFPGGGPGGSVIEASRRVSHLTKQKAHLLNPMELSQLSNLLQNAESLLLTAGNYQPQGPQCKLNGAGYYRTTKWKYLIDVDGNTIDATNDFTEALNKLSAFRANGICIQPFTVTDTCELSGAQYYDTTKWKYVIKVKGEIIDGSNDFSMVQSRLQALNQTMICRSIPKQNCSLQGQDYYDTTLWNFLVSIGSEVVEGFQKAEQATARINDLRRMNLCF